MANNNDSETIKNFGVGEISAIKPFGLDNNNSNNTGSGSPGYGYGYGSGGSSDTEPTDEQKRAADNMWALAGADANNLLDKAGNTNKLYDIAQQQNRNIAQSAISAKNREASNDWYLQYQAMANALGANRSAMGNSLYGSGYAALNGLGELTLDRINAQTKNNIRSNADEALQDLYESEASINNSRNNLALETDFDLRALYSDTLAGVNNIHPDLAKDYIDTENNTVTYNDQFSALMPGREREQVTLRPDEYANDYNASNGYFQNNMRNALAIRDFVRNLNPAGTRETLDKVNNGTADTSGAANQEYWMRLANGYENRR